MLVTAYVAVCLGIGRYVPWLGFLLFAFGVPAVIRSAAVAQVQQRRLRPVKTFRERLHIFVESLALVAQANVIGALVFSSFVGVMPGSFGWDALLGWPAAEVFILPSMLWLAAVVFWLRLTWPRW
jgi:hypothetical protein